jgi:hypothetical protein
MAIILHTSGASMGLRHLVLLPRLYTYPIGNLDPLMPPLTPKSESAPAICLNFKEFKVSYSVSIANVI